MKPYYLLACPKRHARSMHGVRWLDARDCGEIAAQSHLMRIGSVRKRAARRRLNKRARVAARKLSRGFNESNS